MNVGPKIELRMELIDAGRGIRLTTQGVVPGAMFIHAHMTLAEERKVDLSRCRYWFSDHSALDARLLSAVDATTVARLGARLMEQLPDLAIANLAGNDLAFGMLRMWESQSEEIRWQSRTFRDRSATIPWLREATGLAVDPEAPALGGPLYLFQDFREKA